MKKQNIILDCCIEFLESEEIKAQFKKMLKPIFESFLNEISVYLFFFVFFILASFLLHLGILILLIRYNKTNQ